jgi:hypothetical protein
MARLPSAFAFGMLVLASSGAGAAPGDVAADFLPFGTGGKIERVGLSGLTGGLALDSSGRVIVVGSKDGSSPSSVGADRASRSSRAGTSRSSPVPARAAARWRWRRTGRS